MIIEDIETILREAILSLYQEEEIAREIERIVDKRRVKPDGFRRGLGHYVNNMDRAARDLDDQLVSAAFAQITDEKVKPFDQLTFNELTEVLLRHPNCPTPIGVQGFRRLLNRVRDVRNDLAHFRGEVAAEQREALRYCSEWMGRHMQPAGLANKPLEQRTVVVPTDAPPAQPDSLSPTETVASDDSTYAALAIFLKSQPPEIDALTLTFEEIERVIDYKLPKSARAHRAWWSNNPTHVQAAQWLDVGWRAQAINMSEKRVTFVRIAEREEAYIHFFSAVLNRLRSDPHFPLKSLSPQGVSWHILAEFSWIKPNSAYLNASFTRQKTLRVEVYLDSGNTAETKAGFDALLARK